jgi:hypothetical protein
MKITADLQKQLTNLSDAQRARVVAIAHRHAEACRRQGLAAELPGRVLKEAIELVVLEDESGKNEVEDWTSATVGEGLEQQRYEVYRTPTNIQI